MARTGDLNWPEGYSMDRISCSLYKRWELARSHGFATKGWAGHQSVGVLTVCQFFLLGRTSLSPTFQ